jgi:molecular chaperone DnaK
VGRFLIQSLAEVPAGNQIVVQLDLTLDGILKVSAREKATGLQKQVTIENALVHFERDERAIAQQRLDRLWDEADADLEDAASEQDEEDQVPQLVPGPREGQREAVQARALIEKAERVLERLSKEDRSDIEKLMERVRIALADRHWDTLTSASNELADLLFYVEDV